MLLCVMKFCVMTLSIQGLTETHGRSYFSVMLSVFRLNVVALSNVLRGWLSTVKPIFIVACLDLLRKRKQKTLSNVSKLD